MLTFRYLEVAWERGCLRSCFPCVTILLHNCYTHTVILYSNDLNIATNLFLIDTIALCFITFYINCSSEKSGAVEVKYFKRWTSGLWAVRR
jgi:hypothetical protein